MSEGFSPRNVPLVIAGLPLRHSGSVRLARVKRVVVRKAAARQMNAQLALHHATRRSNVRRWRRDPPKRCRASPLA